MTDGSQVIPKDTLWQDYYANLKTALASMRELFRLRAQTDGLTQDDIAASLDIDKSLVSRRLKGEENFTLKTLSSMATAMRCRLQIRFRPYEELGHGNNYDLARDGQEQPKGLPSNEPQVRDEQPKGLDQAA
jgi:transcriptional regulator with XRE-family HTH domain